MRPRLVAWLLANGLPGGLAPDYVTMAGLAGLVGALLVMRVARRDGADVAHQARALLLAYGAALLGGFVFEWIRALPLAIATQSAAPVLYAGRAAYGGLLAGLLAPAAYLRWKKQPILPFLDRAVIPMGVAFALVRVGCFLEGCDFGRPTALPWGVRFPPGSLAANLHVARGWVPDGAPSLPVHPTELYESLLGVGALLVSLPLLLGKKERDGRAFATWMTTYAVGRFAIELLRGDDDRGVYGLLSTAQYVSIALVVALAAALAWRARARPLLPAAATLALGIALAAAPARAQPKGPDSQAASVPAEVTLVDGRRVAGTLVEVVAGDHVALQLASGEITSFAWSSIAHAEVAGAALALVSPSSTPARDTASSTAPPPSRNPPDRRFTLRGTFVSSVTMARPDVPSGWAMEIDALYRVRLGPTSRLELGLEGRRLENVQATEWSLGVPLELVLEIAPHLETTVDLVVSDTWFLWSPAASSFFPYTDAYGVRIAGGVQLALEPHLLLGVSPIAFTTMASETVGVITAYEPRLWAGVDF